MEGRWRQRFRADVTRALGKGMRPGVFAKVGDSNLIAYNAFYGLGAGTPVWSGHDELEPVMRRYRETELPPGPDLDPLHSPPAADRRPWNSFTRCSGSAMLGIIAEHLVTPPERMEELPHWWRCDPDRREGESALETEIRLTRPLWCFIQVGSNGISYGRSPESTADGVADLVRRVRRLGSVPVVFTLPPQLNHVAVPGRWEFALETNRLICATAVRERTALFNQWLAMVTGDLVNHGLVEFDGEIFDGLHLETVGGFKSPQAVRRAVEFTPESLRYGANLRNLLVLRLLRDLDRAGDVG